MTVVNTSAIITYPYVGPENYSFPYKTFNESDLKITHFSTLGIATNMSEGVEVIRNSDGVGGEIVVTSTIYGFDGTIEIFRELPFTQAVDWRNNSTIPMLTLENSFDKAVMLIQQMLAILTGSVVVSRWRGAWVSGADYVAGEIASSETGSLYVAKVGHISTTSFADDLASGYWELFLDVAIIRQYSEVAAASAVQATDAELVCVAAENSVLLSKGMIDQSEALAAQSAIQTRDCATATFDLTVRAEQAAETAEAIVASGSRTDAITTDFFTATAAQTNFALTEYGPEENLLVFINGIKLRLDQDYTTDSATVATTVILSTPADGDEEVEVICFNTSVLGA